MYLVVMVVLYVLKIQEWKPWQHFSIRFFSSDSEATNRMFGSLIRRYYEYTIKTYLNAVQALLSNLISVPITNAISSA